MKNHNELFIITLRYKIFLDRQRLCQKILRENLEKR